jgi:hypothetical protein
MFSNLAFVEISLETTLQLDTKTYAYVLAGQQYLWNFGNLPDGLAAY